MASTNLTRVPWKTTVRGNLPKRDFILPGLKPKTVGMIIAPGGVGKSFFSLQTCISIAAGYDVFKLWNNAPISPGLAVYVNVEDEVEDIEDRMAAVYSYCRDDADDPFDRNNVSEDVNRLTSDELLDLVEENLEVRAVGGDGVDEPDLTIAEPAGDRAEASRAWADFVEEMMSLSPRIVNLDTYTLLTPGLDHNSSGQMADVLTILKRSARQIGCPIVLNHHVSKAAQNSGTTAEQTASRGSAVLTDNVRWQLNLSYMSEQEAKQRGLDPDDRFGWIASDAAKRNFGPRAGTSWIRRSTGGVLVADVPPARQEKSGGKKKWSKEVQRDG